MFSYLLNAIFLRWPYFCGCLFFGVTTPLAVIVFDLRWWAMVLLGVAIFVGWIILGLLLQLAYGGPDEENR